MKAGRLVSFAVAAGLAASVEGQVAKPTEPYAQPLGSGAVRFFESEEAFKAAQSSFALEATPRRALPLPKDFPFTPRFGTNGDQQLITVTKPPGVRLYGLGPIPGSMLRDGFKSESPIDFPWVMGIRPDGTAFGIMVDTGYITGVDLTKDIVFSTPAPNPGLIIWEAPEPHDLLVALNEQSGRMEMPPRWSLGFSVTTDRDPVSLARELRSRAIPTDSMSIPAGDARAEGSTGVEDKPAAELQVLRGLNIHAIQTLFAAAPVHPGVAA